MNDSDRLMGNLRVKKMAECMRRLREPLQGCQYEIGPFTGYEDAKDTALIFTDYVLLPISRFCTEQEASLTWEKVELILSDAGVGPANIWPEVGGIFAELVFNAAQHSFSPQGSCATVECFECGGEVTYIIAVADAGIGIPSSLRKNSKYADVVDDWSAISSATELGVTGTKEQRGVGLHYVAERVRAYLGELAIISGNGFMMFRQDEEPVLRKLSEPPEGTTVLVSLPIPPLGQSHGRH